jgi:hypothetical protein
MHGRVLTVLLAMTGLPDSSGEIDRDLSSGIEGEVNGWTISVDARHGRIVQIFRTNEFDLAVGENYTEESCVLSPTSPKYGKPAYIFACSPSGRSPLAGVKYESHYVKGDCKARKAAKQQYVCVSGCKRTPRTPSKLIQNYWVCAK